MYRRFGPGGPYQDESMVALVLIVVLMVVLVVVVL